MRRKTHDEFLKEVSEARSDITVLSPYETVFVQVQVSCNKCGHAWYAYPRFFTINGSKRSMCSKCREKEKIASVVGSVVVTKTNYKFRVTGREVVKGHVHLRGVWEGYEFKGEQSIRADSFERESHGPDLSHKPGEFHKFPCGCSGRFPLKHEANKFAGITAGQRWRCRVAKIVEQSVHHCRKLGYASIDKNTPHAAIRALMENENCWRCKKPLVWVFGLGKTPHLHHNHQTGEIYGFTHPKCNPLALEHEIEELRDEIAALKLQLLKAA
jgi:hypothetical protein